MNKKMAKNRENVVMGMVIILIAILIGYFSFYMHEYVSNFINSDDASELILSKLLYEEKRILSPNWYYSTELRVLNTQLVFAPLFHFFSDWNTVRVCGAVILLIIMLISVMLFGASLGLTKIFIAILAMVMLVPFSEGYFLLVMTKSYYIPHITISFLTLAIIYFVAHAHSRNTVIVLSMIIGILAVFAGMGGASSAGDFVYTIFYSFLDTCIP